MSIFRRSSCEYLLIALQRPKLGLQNLASALVISHQKVIYLKIVVYTAVFVVKNAFQRDLETILVQD